MLLDWFWAIELHNKNAPPIRLLTAAEYFILQCQYLLDMLKSVFDEIHDLLFLNFLQDLINEEDEEPAQLARSVRHPTHKTYTLIVVPAHISKSRILMTHFHKELAPQQ